MQDCPSRAHKTIINNATKHNYKLKKKKDLSCIIIETIRLLPTIIIIKKTISLSELTKDESSEFIINLKNYIPTITLNYIMLATH